MSLAVGCIAQVLAWDCASRQHRGCYENVSLSWYSSIVHVGAWRAVISPCGSAGYRRDSHVHDSPNHCPWSTDNPYPNYSSLTTGIQPFVNGTHDYSPVLRPRAPPRRASVSPQCPPGGAAGIARPPSRPPSLEQRCWRCTDRTPDAQHLLPDRGFMTHRLQQQMLLQQQKQKVHMTSHSCGQHRRSQRSTGTSPGCCSPPTSWLSSCKWPQNASHT